MSDFIITCGSPADLSKEHFERIGVQYICFHYMIGGKSYPDDLGESMPLNKFYKMMEDGADTSTSQVNIDGFVEFFSKLLDSGKDLIHLELSSGLSGSYGSSCAAAEALRKKYPDQKIYVVDSLGASSGYGLFVHTLAKMLEVLEGRHDSICPCAFELVKVYNCGCNGCVLLVEHETYPVAYFRMTDNSMALMGIYTRIFDRITTAEWIYDDVRIGCTFTSKAIDHGIAYNQF